MFILLRGVVMSYSYERRKLLLMREGKLKSPYGVSTFGALIERFDGFCSEVGLSRSEGIEVAMLRLMESWDKKKEKYQAIDMARFSSEMDEDNAVL
jgi:hypothetical protein